MFYLKVPTSFTLPPGGCGFFYYMHLGRWGSSQAYSPSNVRLVLSSSLPADVEDATEWTGSSCDIRRYNLVFGPNKVENRPPLHGARSGVVLALKDKLPSLKVASPLDVVNRIDLPRFSRYRLAARTRPCPPKRTPSAGTRSAAAAARASRSSSGCFRGCSRGSKVDRSRTRRRLSGTFTRN